MKRIAVTILGLLVTLPAFAQFRPPPFAGGIPGQSQFRALEMQRHQARTLLYREALEELRKNPQAADVPVCPTIQPATRTLCIRRPVSAPPEPTPSAAAPSAPTPAAAPTSPTVVAAAPVTASSAQAPTRKRAVLFGNNAYSHPIPKLDTPIADVSEIANVLQAKFGYETRVVKDAGKAQIIEVMNEVAEQAAAGDSVLLFYAGHGYLMDDTKMGYWIPVDASAKTAKGWISNTDISKLLAAIPARQLILISDSCYSGTLTKEQKLFDAKSINTDDIFKRRSVLAFSSGADEPVSDEGKDGHSIFAWNLIKTLKSSGGVTPGAAIWLTVRDGVVKDYEQQPQYGAVVSAGHETGGDFLFQTTR